jgi:hypothetical protein
MTENSRRAKNVTYSDDRYIVNISLHKVKFNSELFWFMAP